MMPASRRARSVRLVALALLALAAWTGTPVQAGAAGDEPRPWPGRPPRPAPPELAAVADQQGVGADPAGLAAFIADTMAAKHIPGLQAAIIKDGGLYWSGAFGLADPSLGEPVGPSTLFMLASISKTVTGATLLQLLDQGLLELDDPLDAHLPFPLVHPVHSATPITVRMLLCHMGSLQDNWSVMPYYPGDPPHPLGDYLQDYFTPAGALYDPAKSFFPWEPGTAYAYCNNGLALAGYLVECLTGQPFPEVCDSGLFTPLGMDASAWFLAELDPAQVAMPCRWNGAAFVPYGHYGYSDYPSGQLRTTADELARFLLMVMQDGRYEGQALLQEATAQALTTPQYPALQPSQGLVFHGWSVGGRKVWGHGGGDQGVTTEMWFDPSSDIGVVALTNGEAYFSEIVDALFDHAEALPPATSLTTDVASLPESTGGKVRFTIRGGTSHAGRAYVLFGGVSGSSPGTPLPGGAVTLPVNWDIVTEIMLEGLNSPMFAGFHGTLGSRGIGLATWDTLGPLPPGAAGLTVTFAAAFMDPWTYVSNPVEIAITP